MREKKKLLKFKKIKIASMNFLKGGGETDACISIIIDCPQVPASAPGNPCSDTCMVYQTGVGPDLFLCNLGRHRP